MPSFTPPTRFQPLSGTDPLFGRYRLSVGLSVVKKAGHYMTTPYPWLGEIASLEEGRDWFQGGRTYTVTSAVAAQLTADGFTVDDTPGGDDETPTDPLGFGEGGFGEGGFGA